MRGRRERRTEESLAWLRDRLHAEAERHRPDTARIWARVEAALNEPPAAPEPLPVARRPRRGRGALRVAVAALATAGVLGATSLAAVMRGGGTDPEPAVPPPPPRTGAPLASSPATVTVSPSPGEGVEAEERTVESSRPPAPKDPGREDDDGPRPAPVSVTAAHDRAALPHRGRDVLRLTVRRPLTTLHVTIRVARSRRTFPAGSWTSPPGSPVRSAIDLAPDAIVYRYVLSPGRTLPPGEYVIAAQYRPGGPHDPGRDVFVVTVRAAGAGAPSTIRGRF